MKIAILSDSHLGYARFEKDAFEQTKAAFLDAQEKSDIIIYAGDVFDAKIPKLETLNQAVEILKNIKIPVYAIHGNHERRSKEMINPVQLLSKMDLLNYIHAESVVFEKNNEKIQIFGLGNIPEDYANTALKKSLEGFTPDEDKFKILVLHQTITDFVSAQDGINVEDLEPLPFDLIINGHIHRSMSKMDGKLLIPGSTVLTQLKEEETASKGYFLYDTNDKKHEFVEIHSRKFIFEEIKFENAGISELKEKLESRISELKNENPDAIIRVKLSGTLREGINPGDLGLSAPENVYLSNELNVTELKDRLERIRKLRDEKLSVRDIAIKELEEKTKNITTFKPKELFEKLDLGSEEALQYLLGEKE